MLDVLGKEYVSQHIRQSFEQEQKEYLYRVYITESLWCIARGRALEVHYKDLLAIQKPEENQQTPEEVISRMKNKLSQL